MSSLVKLCSFTDWEAEHIDKLSENLTRHFGILTTKHLSVANIGKISLKINFLTVQKKPEWSHLPFKPRLNYSFNLFQKYDLLVSVRNFLVGTNEVVCDMGPLQPPKGDILFMIRLPALFLKGTWLFFLLLIHYCPTLLSN